MHILYCMQLTLNQTLKNMLLINIIEYLNL